MTGQAPVRGARSLLTVAALAVMLAAADTYVVVLALPDMMAGAGLGIESLQRGTPIISGFLLGYIAVLPLIGRLADLVPRRKILIACLLIFVLGSAVTALAVDLNVLVGGRFLQGIGGGGLVPATLAMVADLWPPGQRGTPLGVVGGVQELGAVLGPLLGAAVLLVSDWRGIFWLNVALGLLFVALLLALGQGATAIITERPQPRNIPRTALAWVIGLIAAGLWLLALTAPEALVTSVAYGEPFIPFGETSTSRVWTPVGLAATIALLAWAGVTVPKWWPVLRQVDLWGAALIAIALGSLVLTFSSAEPETEVLGPLGWWLLPVGALAVVAFAIRQKTAKSPLIPSGVVRARVWPALLVSLLVGAAIVAIVVDVPLLARLDGESTQTEAALVLVRFLVAVPIGAVLGGVLLRWLAPGVVAAAGLAATTVGLTVMAGWDRASLGADWETTWVLGLAGLGVGMAIAPVNDAALADSRPDAHGTVSSLVVVARMVGMVVGLAALTAYGLRQFYEAVALLPDPTDTVALLDAGVVQVQSVFAGAALAAGLAAVLALGLGLKRADKSTPSA
ncbi:MFS transporter [Ornithinimicrobium sp. Arc0846-15]|nr:MFS transporter [Ornithinimicrobium laminariae]